VINNPGLVNVDFADVRTVMGEVGMAMMGSRLRRRRSRAAGAEQAVRSPLLEDVNLAGARGVLVNVTASSGLRMREYQEVMTTIKEFTADDALVIVGTGDRRCDGRPPARDDDRDRPGGAQAVEARAARAEHDAGRAAAAGRRADGTDNVGVSVDTSITRTSTRPR
jgi:hypothetical protein